MREKVGMNCSRWRACSRSSRPSFQRRNRDCGSEPHPCLSSHNSCIPTARNRHAPKTNPLTPCFDPKLSGLTVIILVDVADSLNTGSVGTLKYVNGKSTNGASVTVGVAAVPRMYDNPPGASVCGIVSEYEGVSKNGTLHQVFLAMFYMTCRPRGHSAPHFH